MKWGLELKENNLQFFSGREAEPYISLSDAKLSNLCDGSSPEARPLNRSRMGVPRMHSSHRSSSLYAIFHTQANTYNWEGFEDKH